MSKSAKGQVLARGLVSAKGQGSADWEDQEVIGQLKVKGLLQNKGWSVVPNVANREEKRISLKRELELLTNFFTFLFEEVVCSS